MNRPSTEVVRIDDDLSGRTQSVLAGVSGPEGWAMWRQPVFTPIGVPDYYAILSTRLNNTPVKLALTLNFTRAVERRDSGQDVSAQKFRSELFVKFI
jgi:hypothetical protein